MLLSDRRVRGLLADANLTGHFRYLLRLLQKLDLAAVFAELSLHFLSIDEAGLPLDIDDRSLWGFCQREGWVLYTANRNAAGADSLQQTLDGLWQPGCLPLITLANKIEFEHSAAYRERVAIDVAELLFGVAVGDYCDESRIYVPRT